MLSLSKLYTLCLIASLWLPSFKLYDFINISLRQSLLELLKDPLPIVTKTHSCKTVIFRNYLFLLLINTYNQVTLWSPSNVPFSISSMPLPSSDLTCINNIFCMKNNNIDIVKPWTKGCGDYFCMWPSTTNHS